MSDRWEEFNHNVIELTGTSVGQGRCYSCGKYFAWPSDPGPFKCPECQTTSYAVPTDHPNWNGKGKGLQLAHKRYRYG